MRIFLFVWNFKIVFFLFVGFALSKLQNHMVQYLYVYGEVVGRTRGGRAHSLVSPSADSRRAVASYWRNNVHLVLVNRLGNLSLPGNSGQVD